MKFKIFFFLTIILIFITGAVMKYYYSPPAPFAYDEPDYVANSMLFSKFNFGINTDPLIWSQRWAYDQPHLYHFLSAMFLESKYQQPIDTILSENQLNQRYSYGNPSIIFGKIGDGKTLSDPEIISYKKAYQVIRIARELSFYFYLAGGVILISVVYFFNHPILAVPVSIFYLNAYFHNISILAQADGLLILLILINTLLSLSYIKFTKHRLMKAVLLGISCGLALSTKLNGGLTLISSTFCIFTVLFSKSKGRYMATLLHLPIIIFLTFVVFYWLNPYLYSSSIQNISNMFQYRIEFGSYFKLLTSDETFPAGLASKVMAVFENLYQQTGQSSGFSLIFSMLSSILSFVFIFLILTKRVVAKSTTKFLLVSSTFSFFLVLVYIPINWSRYYYPAIILNIFMSVSIITILIESRAQYFVNLYHKVVALKIK